MKSRQKNKTTTTKIDIISFLDKRIQRISNELEIKKNQFNKSKNDLFSDNIFSKNISAYSKMSLLIKQ